MKKSNILIVIFFALLPAGLFLYNRLLANEFINGHLSVDMTIRDVMSTMRATTLQPFRHIVVDGALRLSDEPVRNESEFWYRLPVTIESSPLPTIQVEEYFLDVVKFRQAADTLFVTLESDFQVSGFTVTPMAVRITAPELSSLNTNNVKFLLTGFYGTDSLFLKASNSEVNIGNLRYPLLHTVLGQNSKLTLPGGSEAPQRTIYELGPNSNMTIPSTYMGRLEAGQLAPSATITYTGNAAAVNKAIVGVQQ